MPLTVIKKLPNPISIGGQSSAEIEARPATMQDVIDAEKEASPMHPNAFTVALACRQIVRVGTFTGPFVAGHFHKLRPATFAQITGALQEADALGEE